MENKWNNTIRGRLWILGDSIDTDLIVPSRVLTEQDKQKQLDATLELTIPNFATLVQKNDIILAGKNFGCGSSREEAVYVLKELGISAIIAESFSRIYFRNCINQGLPPINLLVSKDSDTQDYFKQGDVIEIDFSQGKIYKVSENVKILENSLEFKPFPKFLQAILQAGGIIPLILEKNQ